MSEVAISPPSSNAGLENLVWDWRDVEIGDARAGTKDKPFVFGENSMLFRYSPRHRWYYYPDLRNDENLEDPSVRDPSAERTNVHGAVYAFFE